MNELTEVARSRGSMLTGGNVEMYVLVLEITS